MRQVFHVPPSGGPSQHKSSNDLKKKKKEKKQSLEIRAQILNIQTYRFASVSAY